MNWRTFPIWRLGIRLALIWVAALGFSLFAAAHPTVIVVSEDAAGHQPIWWYASQDPCRYVMDGGVVEKVCTYGLAPTWK